MKKRITAALAAALAICAFVGVSQASAATEFGSACTGEEAIPADLISLSHGAGSPLPVAAPTSGIITQWTVTANLEVEPEEEEFLGRLFRQTLNVYKPAGPNTFTLVSQTEGGPLNFHGAGTYQSRIPVAAGDLIGLAAPFALYCVTTDPADKIGYAAKKMTVGSTHTFLEKEEQETEIQVPVAAKIEPDVDGDGYGDETQDQCPQSAAYQTPCPVVTLSSLPLAGKGAVTVRVATSLSAPVGVTGTVKVKGKTTTITAAPQTVAPGSLAAFTLTLPKSVTKALKELPTKKSLTMSITASATNVTGSPSTTASTVKLKGEAKPVHHKKKTAKKKK